MLSNVSLASPLTAGRGSNYRPRPRGRAVAREIYAGTVASDATKRLPAADIQRQIAAAPPTDYTESVMRFAPFDLERHFAAHEFSARRLLSSSDCESLSLAELLSLGDDMTRALWDELRLGYTEARGHPLLRREIASLYSTIGEHQVLECAPSEGIFLALNAILSPGDHVVATYPGYQSLYDMARSIGCRVSFWTPHEDQGFRFDPEDLRALVRDGAKAVVVNFPHNPTGWLPSHEDFANIVTVVREASAWLFADEMYRFQEYAPDAPLPSAVDSYERAIVLGGLSKSFGLPGLRVGWLASQSQEALEQMMQIKDYTTLCGSAPSEILAIIALRERKRILARTLSIVLNNLSAIDSFMAASSSFCWSRPRAGSIGFARLVGTNANQGAATFCSDLLRDTGIMLLPSTLFAYGDQHVRFGFGRADFAEALSELEAWMKQR